MLQTYENIIHYIATVKLKPWLHVQLLHAIILAPIDRRVLK